eukprot:366476-Chlamydomonas_euryale.AAC.12
MDTHMQWVLAPQILPATKCRTPIVKASNLKSFGMRMPCSLGGGFALRCLQTSNVKDPTTGTPTPTHARAGDSEQSDFVFCQKCWLISHCNNTALQVGKGQGGVAGEGNVVCRGKKNDAIDYVAPSSPIRAAPSSLSWAVPCSMSFGGSA